VGRNFVAAGTAVTVPAFRSMTQRETGLHQRKIFCSTV
jgi:hypothetical protein